MMKLNHQPSIMNGPGGILMKKALTTLFGLVFLTGQHSTEGQRSGREGGEVAMEDHRRPSDPPQGRRGRV